MTRMQIIHDHGKQIFCHLSTRRERLGGSLCVLWTGTARLVLGDLGCVEWTGVHGISCAAARQKQNCWSGGFFDSFFLPSFLSTCPPLPL